MLSDVFSSHRPLLFSIAYRMLGSASDAEDVVQDAWLRYSDVDPPTIRSPKALATTAATCRIGHTRVSRVTGKAVTRGRAVFLLKDIFEYGHSEVAEMLGLTVENSRQLLHRAKARLAEPRPRLTGTPESRRAVAERFARAFSSGDGSELSALLAADVGVWSDGGGKASAARRPVLGRDRVLQFLLGLHRTEIERAKLRDLLLRIEDVNSEPALVIRVGARLESIFVFSIDGDTVSGIRVVRNPDKLAHIDRRLPTH
jgi:RNA polymerase sigma-70 factor (ECF subfamily)